MYNYNNKIKPVLVLLCPQLMSAKMVGFATVQFWIKNFAFNIF